MSKRKLLSAVLIAAAMLGTPALAGKGHVTSRHLAEDANASATPGARNNDGRPCRLAPRVGAFATAPWGNGPPCEPEGVFDRSASPTGPGSSLLPGDKSESISVQTELASLHSKKSG
jgi:hypothetical protein